MSEQFKLVVAFPTDDPNFAYGVAWQIARARMISDTSEFVDYFPDAIAEWVVDLAHEYGREAYETERRKADGWTYLKIGASPIEGLE